MKASDPCTTSGAPETSDQRDVFADGFFHAAPIALALLVNRVVRLANPSMCRMLGYLRDELVGQDLRALYLSDDGYEQAGRQLFYLPTCSPGRATFETRWRRKDGVVLDVLISSTPSDPDNPSRGIALSATDITDRKLSELSLRLSEQRFRDISEATGEFIWEINPEGLYAYANRACQTLLGYAEDEVIGKLHFYDLHPVEGREEFRRRAFEVAARKEPFLDFYNPMVTKDGRIVQVLTNGVPILAEDGRLLGYRGSDRDVTELRRTKEALAEEVARRRLLFEQSRDGIVVLDKHGKVYEANQRYADMLGYPLEEVLQLHVWDWDAVYTREELEGMVVAVDVDGAHFETRHRRKDGTFYDVEVSNSGTVVGDEKYILCICRDITARKAGEAALHQAQERLTLALSASKLFVWQWDANTNIVEFAPHSGSAIGTECRRGPAQPLFDQVHPDDQPRFRGAIERSLTGCSMLNEEIRTCTPDGEVRWLSVLGRAEYDDVGAPQRMLGTAQDITRRKHAQEALREREELYSTIVNQASDAIVLIDAETLRFVEFNNAGCRGLGYTREEFGLLQLTDIQAVLTPEQVRQHVASLLAAGGGEFEVRQRKKDGTARDVRVSNRVVKIRGRDFLSAIWTDVTDRKRTDEELRASEAKYRTLFETMSQGVFYQRADGVLLDANPAALAMFGLSREEFLERTSETPEWNVIREDGTPVPASDHPSMFALRAATPVRDAVLGVFNPRIRDYVWMVINATPEFRPGAKKPYRVFVTLHDITARKRAEEALRRSEERYRAVVEDQTEVICRINADGIVTFVSDVFCRFLGKKREEVLGKTWHPVAAAEDLPLVEKQLETLSPGHPVVVVENRVHAGNGDVRWMQFINRAFFDPEGRLVEIQAVGRDVTDRRHAEEERRQLEMQLYHAQRLESVGVMAGGIAHDFNNILSGIRAYADLLQADGTLGSTAGPKIEEIQKATRRAADLTRQLLTYAGKGPKHLELLEISQLVRDMTSMLEIAVSKKTALHFILARDLPAVLADAGQIRQVVMNLIANASESLDGNSGTVTVSTMLTHVSSGSAIFSIAGQRLPDGPYVCLEVADTGCGMDRETLDKIFDPFFTTKFSGRGLGLAAVHGIAHAHQGAIQVASQPGLGSTFRVLLPANASPVSSAKPTPIPAPVRHVSGTVLVVDDEEMVRDGTGALLACVGFRVLKASDGEEAIQICREHLEELVCVILDLTMPKMSGAEVFRALRSIAPRLRIVLTSGYTEDVMMQQFTGERVFGFIQKPDPIDPVVAALIKSLANESGC